MDTSLRLLRLQDIVEWLEHQEVQNTSFRDTYESYEPSHRIDSYEQPPCLGSRISEANRKSDLVCQGIMDRAVSINHKLDEALGLLLSLPKDIGDRDTCNDEVNNISPQNTQPSFEAHTPPVTYPEEVEETLGIPMEVEPLDQAPLEDIGLNTCSYNLTPSSREFPNVDEPEPQPLHNFPSLDIFLGDKRGTDPPINQYYLGSFRMKEAIHSPPSPHVAYSHPKGVYRYFHPHLILSVGKTSPISVK
jgi:hypothetical protein